VLGHALVHELGLENLDHRLLGRWRQDPAVRRQVILRPEAVNRQALVEVAIRQEVTRPQHFAVQVTSKDRVLSWLLRNLDRVCGINVALAQHVVVLP